MDSDLEMESKLISLLTQLLSSNLGNLAPVFKSVSIRIMPLLRSIPLDSQRKPEKKLMSLITQAIFLFNSMDLDSQPKPLSNLISLITQIVNSSDSDLRLDYFQFIRPVLNLNPEPELLSLIYQIFSLVVSLNSKLNNLIALHPQVQVTFKKGKFHVNEEAPNMSYLTKWYCLPFFWSKSCFKGEEATHFRCTNCNGKHHEEHQQAPIEIKHSLHPKHPLQLVLCDEVSTRECYCSEKDLIKMFYFCSTCDFAMNIVCVEKPPILAIDNLKRHEHTLALFPRPVSLTCNVCALDDTSSAIYMCPPCDFFVHLRCINLPRVIKISRHLHRLSFTPSFHQRDFSCGISRKKIDNNYGVILASKMVVCMRLIQYVQHKEMFGMVRNLRESQKKLKKKYLSHL